MSLNQLKKKRCQLDLFINILIAPSDHQIHVNAVMNVGVMRDVVNPWMDEVVGWRPSAPTCPQDCAPALLGSRPCFYKKSFKNLRVFFS